MDTLRAVTLERLNNHPNAGIDGDYGRNTLHTSRSGWITKSNLGKIHEIKRRYRYNDIHSNNYLGRTFICYELEPYSYSNPVLTEEVISDNETIKREIMGD